MKPSQQSRGVVRLSVERAPADLETESDSAPGRRGNRFAWGFIFLLAAGLEALLIYFGHYQTFDRVSNYRALLEGAEPAPVFWVAMAAKLLSLLLIGRLIMAVIPSRADRPRWLAALIGLPLLAAAHLAMSFGVVNLLEAEKSGISLVRPAAGLGMAGLAAALSAALVVTWGVSPGADAKKQARLLLPVLLLSLALGAMFEVLTLVGNALLNLPTLGPVLLAALKLGLVLGLFSLLAAFAGRRLAPGEKVRPGLSLAFFSFFVCLPVALLSLVVPKPHYHADALPVPAMMFSEPLKTAFESDERGDTYIASTSRLRLIIEKDPFRFTLADRDNRVLAALFAEPARSADYQGVCLNRELRGLRAPVLGGPDQLKKTRLRLRSRPVARADSVNVNPNERELVVEARIGDQPAAITFAFVGEAALKLTIEAGIGSPFRSTSLALFSEPGEEFMVPGGLSEFNQAGVELEMILESRPGRPSRDPPSRLSSGRIELFGDRGAGNWPVPFVLLSRGLGIFLAESADPRLELQSRHEDALRFSGRGGPLTLYFIAGRDGLEVFTSFRNLMAPARKPGPELLMPWLLSSLGEAAGGDLNKEMRAVRHHQIPAQMIYLPGPFPVAKPGAEPDFFSELKSALAEGKALGFSFVVDDRAMIARTDPAYQEAVKAGYLVKNRIGLPRHFPGPSGSEALLDFTNPAAVKWRAESWRAMMEAGVSGFALDPRALPAPDSILYSGDPGDAVRNLYPLIYAAAMRSELGEEAVLVNRSGFAGLERYSPATLGGGLEPEFLDRGRDLSMTINLSMAGAPAAGFIYSPRLKPGSALAPEQTLSLSVFSLTPLFFLPRSVAELSEDKDAALLEPVRELARMHVRLLPHLYSLSATAARGGPPALFHPALIEPGKKGWGDEAGAFMLGEALLVVVPDSAGEKTTRVSLPPGRWLDLGRLAILDAGEHEIESAGLTPLLFQREDSVLSLFARPPETLAGGGEARAGPLAGKLALRLFVGSAAAFELFDGTRITVRRAADSIKFRSQGGSPRAYSIEFFDCPRPLRVFVNGELLGMDQWEYKPSSRIISISEVYGEALEIAIMLQ